MTSIFSKMTLQQRHRFVGGRRAYAARRRFAADERRSKVMLLLKEIDMSTIGWRVELARAVGVHPATITRDLRHIAADRELNQIECFANDLEFRQRFLRQIENANARHEANELHRQHASETETPHE